MAQVLVGHSTSGSILQFDQDGDLTSGPKHKEVFFLNFSRLLTKDEVKKGTFSFLLATGSFTHAVGAKVGGASLIKDTNAATNYKVNSPAGEYGILYQYGNATGVGDGAGSGTKVGHIYYQAGVVVLTASCFPANANLRHNTGDYGADYMLTASTIQSFADGVRHRISNISFNNTTELNSSIYFCRVNHGEYNYSANPTYTNGSRIRVKNNTLDNPTSYITTVGLYSADNELLAVAKLSEPLKKDPTNEMILRVRLDY